MSKSAQLKTVDLLSMF